MHPANEEAFEIIDAAFFSGDCFHNRANVNFAKSYIERWQREIEKIEEQLTADEAEADTSNPEAMGPYFKAGGGPSSDDDEPESLGYVIHKLAFLLKSSDI